MVPSIHSVWDVGASTLTRMSLRTRPKMLPMRRRRCTRQQRRRRALPPLVVFFFHLFFCLLGFLLLRLGRIGHTWRFPPAHRLRRRSRPRHGKKCLSYPRKGEHRTMRCRHRLWRSIVVRHAARGGRSAARHGDIPVLFCGATRRTGGARGHHLSLASLFHVFCPCPIHLVPIAGGGREGSIHRCG